MRLQSRGCIKKIRSLRTHQRHTQPLRKRRAHRMTTVGCAEVRRAHIGEYHELRYPHNAGQEYQCRHDHLFRIPIGLTKPLQQSCNNSLFV